MRSNGSAGRSLSVDVAEPGMRGERGGRRLVRPGPVSGRKLGLAAPLPGNGGPSPATTRTAVGGNRDCPADRVRAQAKEVGELALREPEPLSNPTDLVRRQEPVLLPVDGDRILLQAL